ncbi:hypothetical protein P3T42_001500 [Paraburkholderia sp. GAS38]
MMPNRDVRQILLPAYQPCASCVEGDCRNRARWDPPAGHVPRGFCGATGAVDEVRLILVCAEPGDPHSGESHTGDATASGLLDSACEYAWYGFSSGKDLFHRNVRKILDLCWPDADFETQMRRTWITDSVLCSAQKEGGRVSIKVERECARRFLAPQVRLFDKAVVAALGKKAERRLKIAGIEGFISAGSVAPPGCNHVGVYESWLRLAKLVRERCVN